jgi:hypothetical protein
MQISQKMGGAGMGETGRSTSRAQFSAGRWEDHSPLTTISCHLKGSLCA